MARRVACVIPVLLAAALLTGGCHVGGVNERTLLASSSLAPSKSEKYAWREGYYTLVRVNAGKRDTVIRCIRSELYLDVSFERNADGTLTASAGAASISLPAGDYAWVYAEFTQDDWDYEHYWSDPGKAIQTVLAILTLPLVLIAGLFGAKLPFG